jgi:mono/diheme cytochrome c family protein
MHQVPFAGMKFRVLSIKLCIALCCVVMSVACAGASPTPAGPPPEPTLPPMPALRAGLIAEGQPLYAQYCASCHGANLEGQPNWKQPLASGKYPAPPHDDSGHTWHHPDALLLSIIHDGGNGSNGAIPSDMPAFKDQLTRPQMEAVLEYIKSRWSQQHREYQWQMTVQDMAEKGRK